MDTTKLKAAIENAKSEVKKCVEAEMAANSFTNIKRLGGVMTGLTRAGDTLDKKAREKKTKKGK